MIQQSIKVLLIEDNPSDAALISHSLAKLPEARLDIEPCTRLSKALVRLQEDKDRIDIILLDLNLPDSHDLDTLTSVHREAPKIPIVILSARDDENLAIQAVREGAQDYLVKGQNNGELLLRAMHYAMERMRIKEELSRARDELEIRVQERTSELALANESLKRMISQVQRAGREVRGALRGIIQVVSMTIEIRDPYTAGHQKSVADLAEAIAHRMGLPDDRIEGIRLASLVHDLGKISIPAEILSRPSRLNEVEMSLIRMHPQSGYEILNRVKFPWPIAQMVLQHHERLDGSGYPLGLPGPDILLEAKIIGVADVVDAMCSHRPYRPAPGLDKALAQIRQHRGTLYDPDAVDACLDHFIINKPELLESDQGLPKNFYSPRSRPLPRP